MTRTASLVVFFHPSLYELSPLLWASASCQAALNLETAVYLLYVLAGVSLLNEGEQDCHRPEDSAAQPLRSWWIAWGCTRLYVCVCVCVCVCAWTEQEHTCVQIISFCTITVCSNPLRSYSTGSRKQASVPPVIQVFKFAGLWRYSSFHVA